METTHSDMDTDSITDIDKMCKNTNKSEGIEY